MNQITEILKSGKILVSDGAWGTFLHRKGLAPGECPEAWNLTHPDEVTDIARSYFEAGSDMVETNSFGGSKFKLKHYGLENRVVEINEAAARLSKKAAGPDQFVLGSVGPTGIILMMGEVSKDEMYQAFRNQVVALEKGGANAIIVETMSDLEEAELAVKAAKENTSCEVICTMTFEKTVDGDYKTMMGIGPGDVVQPLIRAGADILGSNCGNGTAGMVDILRIFRNVNHDIPLIIQGNAGMPRYLQGKTVFHESPEETASFVPEMLKLGVNIIGGCCGTTPDHIRLVAQAVRKE
jgi:5-methyltetrahydrofolate--homocysteine methyltransferase